MKRLLFQLLVCSSLYMGIYGELDMQAGKQVPTLDQLQQKKVLPLFMSILLTLLIYKYYTYYAIPSHRIGDPLALTDTEKKRFLRFLFPSGEPHALTLTHDPRHRLLQYLFSPQEPLPFALGAGNDRTGEGEE